MRQHPFLTTTPIPKSIPKSAFNEIPTFVEERPPYSNNIESNKNLLDYEEEDKRIKHESEDIKSKKAYPKKETLTRGYFARCFTGSRGPSERSHMEPTKAKALNQKYARANINKNKNQVATSGNILDIVYRNICQAFEDVENNIDIQETNECK